MKLLPYAGLIWLCASGVGLLAQGPDTAARPEAKLVVTCTADHTDAIYHVGEKVTFSVAATRDGKPVTDGEVDWSLTKDTVAPFFHGTVALKDGQATVTGQLDQPGFLQCKVVCKSAQETARTLGAAAIDPLEIGPSLPVPDDFDSFWNGKKAELAKVAINARLTPVPTKVPGIELFEVQADAVGAQPMSGYYARPVGAALKSAPAIIILEGAGVYGTRLEPWLTRFAGEGFLALELNAHGLPSGKPPEFYQALEQGSLKDYQFFGRESRDKFYFLNMFLRDLRGVDFLTSQPEWNGKVLIAFGASQGGAQAICVAAEDSRVTFLATAVPAMCDHTGMLADRVPGWPRMIPVNADGKPDQAVLETSRYFDSMNFATRLTIPAIFAVGFIDSTAPPTSVYAAYNRIKTKKQMIPGIHSPHRIGPEIWEQIHQVVLQQNSTTSEQKPLPHGADQTESPHQGL